MLSATQTTVQKSLLDPIFLDEDQCDISPHMAATYHDPQEIVFSHKFITSEIQKFGLNLEGCINCSQLVRHFIDPRSLYDALSENKIEWIPLDHSELVYPYPKLLTPIFDPSNINIPQNPNWPKGIIRVTWIYKHIPDTGDISRIA